MARTYSECLSRYVRGARLRAVSGGSRAAQLALDYGIDHVPAIETLLAREDVKAIIITTPEMLHKEQTELAAAMGMHILVEKPMAPTLSDCQAMIDACTEARVKLMVVQSQRFRGVHQQAKQILANRRLGPVWQLRHWANQTLQSTLNLVVRSPFYLDPTGGGLYLGFSVHSFDLARWLLGSEVETVYAQVQKFGDHPVLGSSMMAQLGFSNGVMAQIWINLEMPGDNFNRSSFRTQMVCQKGLLDFDGYDQLDMNDSRGWQRIWTQPGIDLDNPQDPVRLESYSSMVQEFVDAIHEDRQPVVTGADGKAAIELSLAAIHSSRTGQVVKLPLSS